MIGQNLVMVGFMAISFQSVAVDINYKDLKRPGRSHTKFYSISGLKSEGDSYINQFNNKDSYRVSKASSVASSSSSSNYEVCNGTKGELCYEVLRKGYFEGTYIIKCIKGFNVGSEHKVCMDGDGDWSNACSLGSYHFNSLRKAANKQCSY